MKGWHFTYDGKLKDGRPVPEVGETLVHEGELEMCRSGFHAAPRILDTLRYTPFHDNDVLPSLHRVELKGNMIHGENKSVAQERTILWTLNPDATISLLRKFARACAMDIQNHWDRPDYILKFLKTGEVTDKVLSWFKTMCSQEDYGTSAERATVSAVGAHVWQPFGTREILTLIVRHGDAVSSKLPASEREEVLKREWARLNRRLTSMVAARQS